MITYAITYISLNGKSVEIITVPSCITELHIRNAYQNKYKTNFVSIKRVVD